MDFKYQPLQKLLDSMYPTLRAKLRALDEEHQTVAMEYRNTGGFSGGISDEEADARRCRELENELNNIEGKHAVIRQLLAPFVLERIDQREEFDRRQCDAMMAL
jgi:hypothetical protein